MASVHVRETCHVKTKCGKLIQKKDWSPPRPVALPQPIFDVFASRHTCCSSVARKFLSQTPSHPPPSLTRATLLPSHPHFDESGRHSTCRLLQLPDLRCFFRRAPCGASRVHPKRPRVERAGAQIARKFSAAFSPPHTDEKRERKKERKKRKKFCFTLAGNCPYCSAGSRLSVPRALKL